MRRENDKFGPGIHAIWGVKSNDAVEIQSIRFDSSKFTPAEAKAWLKEHDYKTSLEEATGKSFQIVKVDEEQRIVFGWGSISMTAEGEEIVDLQQDIIEPDVLEKAAYEFMLESQLSGEMHRGEAVESIVESFVSTPEKLEKMGLAKDSLPTGWWIGVKLLPEVFAKVKAGDYKGFSIEGTAIPEAA